jgi:hypothetical protein
MTEETKNVRTRADISRMLLERAGLPFTSKGQMLEFRDDARPACDYYPATGRWRIRCASGRFKYYRGGPVAFINWYSRQESRSAT